MALVAEALVAAAEDEHLVDDGRWRALVRNVESLRLGPLGVSMRAAPERPPHRDIARLVVALSEHAWQDGRLVLLRLDEVQNVDDPDLLSQLLVAVGDALAETALRRRPDGREVERSLPLAVYLSGLPEFMDSATTREGATFTRRFQTSLLPPLSDEDLDESLEPMVLDGWRVLGEDGPAVVRLASEAAEHIVQLASGDPYIFQLSGQRAWDADESEVISLEHVVAGWRTARAEALRHATRQLDRVPDRERQLLATMARLAPDERTATRLAQEMGYESASQIGTAAMRLEVTRGLIQRGRPYTFTFPLIERFLRGEWPDVAAPGAS